MKVVKDEIDNIVDVRMYSRPGLFNMLPNFSLPVVCVMSLCSMCVSRTTENEDSFLFDE